MPLAASGDHVLSIGIIGMGPMGKFVAELLSANGHRVVGCNRKDAYFADNVSKYKMFSLEDVKLFESEGLDIVIIAVSISSFEEVLTKIPGDVFVGKLVVDMCSVKTHAAEVMLRLLPEACDVLCTHPMFGPRSAQNGLQFLRFMYDRVRVSNNTRCGKFLDFWKHQGCKLIEMTCDAHDRYAANTQFISHFMARVLYEYKIEETPIDTKNVARLRELSTQITEDHSFDLFSGLYRFNKYSPSQIIRLRCALDSIEDNLKNHSTIHKL